MKKKIDYSPVMNYRIKSLARRWAALTPQERRRALDPYRASKLETAIAAGILTALAVAGIA